MTRETFERKFAELCEEKEIAFLCRFCGYAIELEDVMLGLSKFVEEDGNISYLRGRNDALKEMADVIEQNKKEMIDKACDIHCSMCGFMSLGEGCTIHTDIEECETRKLFIQEMMEE